jgi:NADPH-dependent 2,4-dienoyl-CoA reductase/sulfur reductase-like enzyme
VVTGQPEHVLVVGAGLGGLRTVEQLRSAGYQGRISLVGAETHPPYDRPPLSKQVLTGEWPPQRTVLRDAEGLADLGVRAHLGIAAVALRPGEVELADGATLHGDAVVVATGLVARQLPDQPDHPALHTLRTLDDALSLRAGLESARSLLVVGGGFIGAEVASAARARGIGVTVLEAMPVPFSRALGPEVGALCAGLLTESGVDLRTGARPVRFPGDGAGDGGMSVELADGTRVGADVVVVGVGATPRLEWVAGTGLDLTDGLACDASGRVVGAPGVWAVGDVAAWYDPVHGDRPRIEHWTSAADQAAVVARDILTAPPPRRTVPYFWSDQFGLKIQLVGRPELADQVVPLHGDGIDGGAVRGTVAGYLAGDRLVAVASFGAARVLARYRALVAAAATSADTLALAAELS